LDSNAGLPAIDGQHYDAVAAGQNRQIEWFPEGPIGGPATRGQGVAMLDGREHDVAGAAEKHSCQACGNEAPIADLGVGVGVGRGEVHHLGAVSFTTDVPRQSPASW
jgi:hypothetical protein